MRGLVKTVLSWPALGFVLLAGAMAAGLLVASASAAPADTSTAGPAATLTVDVATTVPRTRAIDFNVVCRFEYSDGVAAVATDPQDPNSLVCIGGADWWDLQVLGVLDLDRWCAHKYGDAAPHAVVVDPDSAWGWRCGPASGVDSGMGSSGSGAGSSTNTVTIPDGLTLVA